MYGLKKEVKGREKEIAQVMTAIKSSRQIVLSGTDGIGKTTVLREVQARCADPCVYFSFSKSGDWKKELLDKILSVFSMAGLLDLSLKDLDIELRKIKSNIVREKLKAMHDNVIAEDVWQTADLLAAENEKRIVLLLDDADGIDLSPLKKTTHIAAVATRLHGGDIRLGLLDGKIPLYAELEKSPQFGLFLDLLFKERLKRLSTKELQILTCMARNNLHTPAEVAKKIDYVQTSTRRFMAIMEEKGFLELQSRGRFSIIDKELERWLAKNDQ